MVPPTIIEKILAVRAAIPPDAPPIVRSRRASVAVWFTGGLHASDSHFFPFFRFPILYKFIFVRIIESNDFAITRIRDRTEVSMPVQYENLPSEQRRPQGGNCREVDDQPQPIGQFMAAVLARYGIAPKTETESPRLPMIECRGAPQGDLLAVG